VAFDVYLYGQRPGMGRFLKAEVMRSVLKTKIEAVGQWHQ
jgi:hypothetical protein